MHAKQLCSTSKGNNDRSEICVQDPHNFSLPANTLTLDQSRLIQKTSLTLTDTSFLNMTNGPFP